MPDILSVDRLELFIIFVVPGFVSVKVWRLLVPSQYLSAADSFLEAASYGCINFAIVKPFLVWVSSPEVGLCVTLRIILWLLSFLGLPIAWPILLKWLLSRECLIGKIVQPFPKAWDHFFGRSDACSVIVHLKDGKLIGGLYAGESGVSSYPNEEDIYLAEAWEVNEHRQFIGKVPRTKGLWVSKESFSYIEFFETEPIEEECEDGEEATTLNAQWREASSRKQA